MLVIAKQKSSPSELLVKIEQQIIQLPLVALFGADPEADQAILLMDDGNKLILECACFDKLAAGRSPFIAGQHRNGILGGIAGNNKKLILSRGRFDPKLIGGAPLYEITPQKVGGFSVNTRKPVTVSTGWWVGPSSPTATESWVST